MPCRSHDYLIRNASQRSSKAALRLHSPYQQLRREFRVGGGGGGAEVEVLQQSHNEDEYGALIP